MKNIGFIGAGNMAFAIAGGIRKAYPDANIGLYDVHTEQYERFFSLGAQGYPDIAGLIDQADIIFLSVKPQNFETVLPQIASAANYQNRLYVSIAAGVSTQYISRELGGVRVIRVMPNTPLMKGQGASALSASDAVSEEEFSFVQSIFAAMGVAKRIPEEQMNAVIAVNGSSPAYIYLFAKAVVDNAVKSGMDAEVAKELFCQTLIGSAAMLMDPSSTPEELIHMVSSPGGTTLAALDVFYENHFSDIIDAAMDACTDRAKEIGK